MSDGLKHILVIDDDTRLRSLLQRYLREQGFQVSAVKGTRDAESLLEYYKIDLINLSTIEIGSKSFSQTEKIVIHSNLYKSIIIIRYSI